MNWLIMVITAIYGTYHGIPLHAKDIPLYVERWQYNSVETGLFQDVSRPQFGRGFERDRGREGFVAETIPEEEEIVEKV